MLKKIFQKNLKNTKMSGKKTSLKEYLKRNTQDSKKYSGKNILRGIITFSNYACPMNPVALALAGELSRSFFKDCENSPVQVEHIHHIDMN